VKSDGEENDDDLILKKSKIQNLKAKPQASGSKAEGGLKHNL